ncbi:tyrosine-type recombinase/integrase [Conexibacter woesei]|uniref:Integrase family protein n=1 Tax=Conexibacter woesei (strain DSM 14684 / CCUG 47730 / CIP 108061 / JCM 11494 / NBRC 100937 / ID131577) TaxID=469383 RepID=D3F211_CONWI|nr:site-specific integrase [Conexibacter woesei]ADB50186.1 integrase family protein [Conexibacter woesei DSM 14684]
MPRQPTGEVRIYTRADGGVTYYARFRALGRRWRVKLGTDIEGWNETRAENAVGAIVDRVRRGTWTPPSASRATEHEDPTFHAFASQWFVRKSRGLSARTVEDYEWRLSNHLLPYFARHRLSELDVRAVDGYRAAKLAERDEARAAGRRALSNDSINATIGLLAQILDEAAEHKLPVERPNPAKGRRRRLKTQRGQRSFLEPDQAAALLDAAGRLDASGPLDWETVCAIRASAESNVALARRHGVSDSLVSRVRRGLVWRTPASAPARRPVVATLLLAGPRVAELCALDVADVDLEYRRLRIRDAKTAAGRRQIVVSDLLAAELAPHIARSAGAGGAAGAGAVHAVGAAAAPAAPADPARPLFANTRGERYTPSGIRTAVLAPAVALASRTTHGLPAVTPHTLRRTFISLLLAGGADVPWVMAQVGHTDPKVTLQIYAQVVQSQQRDYGARVDRMIGGAAAFGTGNGTTRAAASVAADRDAAPRPAAIPVTTAIPPASPRGDSNP